MESLESDFTNLSIKFLFVYEDSVELNLLLNDLNSLDYRFQQISTNVIDQFIEAFCTKIPTTSENNIIVKTCNLLKQLINKQKIILPEQISNKLINWIIHTQTSSATANNIFLCEAIDLIALLFKKNFNAVLSVS